MSDGEDDFMCEEEEDYGLVSIHIYEKYTDKFKKILEIG